VLVLRLARAFHRAPHATRRALKPLFPRTATQAKALRPWRCAHSGLGAAVRAALQTLPDDVAARLPHVVRYNAIDATTGGERFAYPGSPESALAGVGLFAKGSIFNHARRPNVARWHCGDVVVFRTNRRVAAGEALTVSYCPAPLLADGAAAAAALAHFDFAPAPEVPLAPVVDDEVQAALQRLTPKDRLARILAADRAPLLHADVLELEVQEALARGALGDVAAAADAWDRAALRADLILPACDEQIVALRTQQAKLLAMAGEADSAACVLAAAYAAHAIAFAPGRRLFVERFADDFDLEPEDETDAVATLVGDFLGKSHSR